MNVSDRALPMALEAERAVLGAVLVDPAAYASAAAVLCDADFGRDAHRRIFAQLVKLSGAGSALDLLTLKDALARSGELEEVGGPVYIAGLLDGVPRATNVAHYASIVLEKARLRGLIFTANRVLADAYAAEQAPEGIADAAVRALQACAMRPLADVFTAGEAAQRYVRGLDRDGSGGLKTGFADLDAVLGASLRPKRLAILAGRPSAGKSSLGLGMAKGLAEAGCPTAFFSLEMHADALGGRLVAWTAHVASQRLAEGVASPEEYARVAGSLASLEALPLRIQDTAATLAEVGAWCQRLKAELGLQVAVVDYLQLLLPATRSQSREQDVAALAYGLKQLAKTQDLLVVALSALGRSPEGRKDNRPRLSDLRESGALEYHADVVLLLFRAEQYDPEDENRGVAEVIVAKSRDGAVGTTRLAFLAEYAGMFADLARG